MGRFPGGYDRIGKYRFHYLRQLSMPKVLSDQLVLHLNYQRKGKYHLAPLPGNLAMACSKPKQVVSMRTATSLAPQSNTLPAMRPLQSANWRPSQSSPSSRASRSANTLSACSFSNCFCWNEKTIHLAFSYAISVNVFKCIRDICVYHLHRLQGVRGGGGGWGGLKEFWKKKEECVPLSASHCKCIAVFKIN